MKLSKQTLDVLRNFATINQNILIQPGTKLSTRTVAKNIFATAEVPSSDEFDTEFGIYNLSEFLGVVSLFTDPDISISHNVITISEGKNVLRYVCANKEILDYPESNVKMPSKDASFELSEEVLKALLKAGAVLGSTDLLLSSDGNTITASVVDPQNPSSNTYSVEVGSSPRKFTVYIKLENLKMPAGIYDVSLSERKLAHFKSKTVDYDIYIGCEKKPTVWEE